MVCHKVTKAFLELPVLLLSLIDRLEFVFQSFDVFKVFCRVHLQFVESKVLHQFYFRKNYLFPHLVRNSVHNLLDVSHI